MYERKEPGAEEQINTDPQTGEYVERMKLVSVSEANSYRFDNTVREIYKTCPYLGFIFNSLKRKKCWDIPTAAISADNILMYNPRFMASMPLEQQKYVEI